MADSVSYTPEEVAQILKISRFTVYEMIKRGDLSAYRIGRKMRVEAQDLELYIQQSKGLSPAVLVKAPKPESSLSGQEDFIICGQDVILDVLSRHLEKELPHVRCLRNYVGSIDGLLALYRGLANVVAVHLWDGDTDTYNIPYVRRLLPGHPALIFNLAYRTAGFYVAKGNPCQITAWPDLIKPAVRFVNRECGAGARVLLDEQLRLLSIDRHRINGYRHEEMSHLAVASSVARDEADVGLGIEKVALQVRDIDFIPLQKERYDLVIRKEDAAKPHFQVLLSVLRSPVLRSELAGMGGYDLSRTGELLART